jgi:hypothetical protein
VGVFYPAAKVATSAAASRAGTGSSRCLSHCASVVPAQYADAM